MPENDARLPGHSAYGLWVWRTVHTGAVYECDDCKYQQKRGEFATQCVQGTHKLAVLCYAEDDTRRPTFLSRIDADDLRAELLKDSDPEKGDHIYNGSFVVECAHEIRGGTVQCAGKELREPEPKSAPRHAVESAAATGIRIR